ncbi:MAG: hypothetical protein MZV49_07935 [Rhodopseudomonas palustris]|nr:hypothetical protein [Rhodopseudomonas palustris]
MAEAGVPLRAGLSRRGPGRRRRCSPRPQRIGFPVHGQGGRPAAAAAACGWCATPATCRDALRQRARAKRRARSAMPTADPRAR